jgi:asparagine synthase (glutamine-hydrolysing)
VCGIAGIFHYKRHAQDDKGFLDAALKTMHHRGPDSSGTWSNNQNYSAGFVRLAIRDLSENGSQPMLSECGNYCISFNGEIYNTQNFKSKLEASGVNFKSTTDTEVLLYAIIKWGLNEVLEKFDGIYAFAFYDHKKNKLLLARDRSGIKPLYIGTSTEGVIYSSQYDHIIHHPYIKNNSIHTGAVGAYMSLGYVPENSGIISNTFMLPHGFYAEVNDTGMNVMRFYNYPVQTQEKSKGRLEDLLEQNVKAQLVSDVPIGTFMSGGVDSPLVSYYANKHTKVKSFNIGVDDPSMDESKAAAEFASIFNTEHFCKHITEKDLLETISDNTKAFTEPFADFSSIPTLILSKFASSKLTVALSGDGGDELFWGYPRNIKMLQQGLRFNKNKAARTFDFLKERITGSKKNTLKRHLLVDDFPSYYYRSIFIPGAEHWLSDVYKPKADKAFFFNDFMQHEQVNDLDENGIMNAVRKLEFDLHLQRILLKVDRASMYHSLEVRVPLLSNDIIEYSTTLDYNDCIKNGQGKYNLKELLIKKSKESLVLQPKKGFVIPLNKWLKQELRKDVEEKLLNMPAELAPLFNRQQIQKLLDEHKQSKHDWSWFIWSLYSLVNWHHQYRNAN